MLTGTISKAELKAKLADAKSRVYGLLELLDINTQVTRNEADRLCEMMLELNPRVFTPGLSKATAFLIALRHTSRHRREIEKLLSSSPPSDRSWIHLALVIQEVERRQRLNHRHGHD